MKFLRIFRYIIVASVIVLASCEDDNVPEELRLPTLPSVNAQVLDGSVVLSAEFKSADDKAAIKEFGFYFGTNETLLERLNVTEPVGLGYSLTMENLEYSTAYLYRVWVSNGRCEISSQLMTIKTGEPPVDPDPPVVDPDPPVNPDPPIDGIIQFKDPAVKSICVAKWDQNGDGELSVEEAGKVTDVNNVFTENKEIVTFGEFKYFTGIEDLAERAFLECSNLVSIELPASITYIGKNAFTDCINLERIIMPSSIRIIDDAAFARCRNLILNKLPDNIVKMGESVFAYCNKLKLTKLPSRLLSIGNWAFIECNELCLTELPSGLVSIGNQAFETCYVLALQNLPDGIQRIGDGAFKYCYELRITELPSQLDSIDRSVFLECHNIRLKKLPANIKSIGVGSFENCTSLEISEIPDAVRKIGETAFSGCVGIKSLVLPKELTKIPSKAFSNCHFKEITIQENVKLIESDAFVGCDRLATVRLLPETPPEMLDKNLGVYLDTIYVPAASLEAYRTAPGWSRWKDRIHPIPAD